MRLTTTQITGSLVIFVATVAATFGGCLAGPDGSTRHVRRDEAPAASPSPQEGEAPAQAEGAPAPAAKEGLLALVPGAAAAHKPKTAVQIAVEADQLRDSDAPDYQEVHKRYRLALEDEPGNTFVLVDEATAYLREGAEAKFAGRGGAETLDPERLHQADLSFLRAKTLAERALMINPTYSTAHFVLAETSALSGDAGKAIEKLEYMEQNKLIPSHNESTFYAWKGYAYQLKGDQEKAKKAFETSREMGDPFESGEYADLMLRPPGEREKAAQDAEPHAIVHSY